MIKALSLWQPWASAIAFGSKLIETRHWATTYRGPLAIHAAKRRIQGELIHMNSFYHWRGAMMPLLKQNHKTLVDDLPFGAIVAVCDLVDCRPTDSFTVAELDMPRTADGQATDLYSWTERQMGDFSPGRFGWVFANVRPLPVPIPFVGRQGLFNVPDIRVLK